MSEQVEINLSIGEGNAVATLVRWNDFPETGPVKVNLANLRDQVLGGLYAAEWYGLSALGVPFPDQGKRFTEGIGGLLPALKANADVKPWVIDLYAAQLRACRSFSRDNGLDVLRKNTPSLMLMENVDSAAVMRAAVGTPVLVTAGVVGVAAAVSIAIAWWARGADQAQANAAAVRQAAAANAASKAVATYIVAGKDPPKELIAAISGLANTENERSYGVPLALAGAVGLGLGAWGYRALTA